MMRIPFSSVIVVLVSSVAASSVVSPSSGEPVLTERAKARVRTVRLRIEPTRLAPPGRCLDLGVADLEISLRGERIVDPGLVELDREPTPALHALVIDTSSSMAGKLDAARKAAAGYVERLRPGLDRALVVTFDEDVILRQSATADRARLIDALARIRMDLTTSMLDALNDVFEELRFQRERPVVILLTDGIDTSSLHERYQVLEAADHRPDLSVFTIGLALPYLASAGPTGLNSTRKFLYRLAARTNGEFFDVPTGSGLERVYRRIREILESEATLSVVDPDPEAEPGRLRVGSRTDACRVTVYRSRPGPPPGELDAAIEDPTPGQPVRLPVRPDEVYRRLYAELPWSADEAARCGEKVAASAGTGEGEAWFAAVEPQRVFGCRLDLTMDHGVLYDPYETGWVQTNEWMRLETRPFEMDVPPLSRLPTGPEEAADELGAFALSRAGVEVDTDPRKRPTSEHARPFGDYPRLADGRTLLEMRPALARSLYLHGDYREWVLAKLREETRRDLEALEDKLRRQVPQRTDDEIRAAARESEEGKRILARRSAPSTRDVVRYLAAWLGDLSAHEFFVRWEAARITELVEHGPGDGHFPEAWHELRRVFFVPSYTRVVGLIAPVHDPREDRIGFYRIVLPRAGWLQTRVQGWSGDPDFSDLPLDLLPDHPYGYLAVREALDQRPDFAAALRAGGYRAVSVSYGLLGKPRKQDPERAFDSSRVSVVFEVPGGGGGDANPRRVLTAVTSPSGRHGDPELSLERVE